MLSDRATKYVDSQIGQFNLIFRSHLSPHCRRDAPLFRSLLPKAPWPSSRCQLQVDTFALRRVRLIALELTAPLHTFEGWPLIFGGDSVARVTNVRSTVIVIFFQHFLSRALCVLQLSFNDELIFAIDGILTLHSNRKLFSSSVIMLREIARSWNLYLKLQIYSKRFRFSRKKKINK